MHPTSPHHLLAHHRKMQRLILPLTRAPAPKRHILLTSASRRFLRVMMSVEQPAPPRHTQLQNLVRNSAGRLERRVQARQEDLSSSRVRAMMIPTAKTTRLPRRLSPPTAMLKRPRPLHHVLLLVLRRRPIRPVGSSRMAFRPWPQTSRVEPTMSMMLLLLRINQQCMTNVSLPPLQHSRKTCHLPSFLLVPTFNKPKVQSSYLSGRFLQPSAPSKGATRLLNAPGIMILRQRTMPLHRERLNKLSPRSSRGPTPLQGTSSILLRVLLLHPSFLHKARNRVSPKKMLPACIF